MNRFSHTHEYNFKVINTYCRVLIQFLAINKASFKFSFSHVQFKKLMKLRFYKYIYIYTIFIKYVVFKVFSFSF